MQKNLQNQMRDINHWKKETALNTTNLNYTKK